MASIRSLRLKAVINFLFVEECPEGLWRKCGMKWPAYINKYQNLELKKGLQKHLKHLSFCHNNAKVI